MGSITGKSATFDSQTMKKTPRKARKQAKKSSSSKPVSPSDFHAESPSLPDTPSKDLPPVTAINQEKLGELETLHPGAIEQLLELTELQTRQHLKLEERRLLNDQALTQAKIQAIHRTQWIEIALCIINAVLAGLLISKDSSLVALVVILATTGFIAARRKFSATS